MDFIKGRIKELTSLHGGVLIGLGVVVLFLVPLLKLLLGRQLLMALGRF